jgi:hypothetical protein
MAASDQRTTSEDFSVAIVREAVDFANKILMLSDPEVQRQHERAMQQRGEGKSMSLDELREKLDLR